METFKSKEEKSVENVIKHILEERELLVKVITKYEELEKKYEELKQENQELKQAKEEQPWKIPPGEPYSPTNFKKIMLKYEENLKNYNDWKQETKDIQDFLAELHDDAKYSIVKQILRYMATERVFSSIINVKKLNEVKDLAKRLNSWLEDEDLDLYS